MMVFMKYYVFWELKYGNAEILDFICDNQLQCNFASKFGPIYGMMVESLCQNVMVDQSIGLFNSAMRSGTAAISDSSVLIFFRSLIKFNYVEGFLVSFKEICQLLKVLPGYLYLKKYGCNFKK